MRKYMTAAEAAEALGLTRAALYMRVHRGTLPYVKWGRAIRFDPRRLEAVMQEGERHVESAA